MTGRCRCTGFTSFDVDRKEAIESLYGEISQLYPDYDLLIIPDVDVAD